MYFRENFLYFIWQFRLFNRRDLYCEDGALVRIVKPGMQNTHAGPDFNGAKLVIDGTTWVGDVEIHVKSSDWLLHGHQHDPSFESVILHVVYVNDKPIYRKDGSLLPVLVLKDLFSEHLLDNYTNMLSSSLHFPCEAQIRSAEKFVVDGFLSRLVVERFEQKSDEVYKKLAELKGDWEAVFYCFMARNFGFKVNAMPFDQLAGNLPLAILGRHKNNALQIEALIFGQAGFLEIGTSPEYSDEYHQSLKFEYAFLKKKYKLMAVDRSLWKFLRMRPQNFPTIRLAQFSALILSRPHLFSEVLELNNLKEVYRLFGKLPVNDFWLKHYHFNKSTRFVNVQLGAQSVQNLVINTVCLFLFAYGKYTAQPQYTERALDFLEQIPAERNSVISQYVNSGVVPDNSFQSQALLQLNKYYCTQKKCLNCSIGVHLLKK
ncbi:DUF2851 family protein [Pedobacter metabolipauper]|uniref:Uncharacterized protein DUF2851 n=1 Tax=Pedobacter metabolipauper TaxID=425513 RepID=A0A4R6SSH3_9SPHI|nr:DUF2851 family protein [Pedobacter metabolipauper]TDQ08335.1 uncharacterized protein DUF2851 [Pedobacter metabolipauper]